MARSQRTLLTVVGARPQLIKAAAISRAVAAGEDVREVMVHTGQHFDDGMSAVFFRELDIPQPEHSLGIHGGSHGAMTGLMLAALEPVLEAERPDWVLVYGDTNSTLAGALAAAKLNLPVGHVETGLPPVYRVIRDLGSGSRRFGDRTAGRALLVVLSFVPQLAESPNRIFTEERCQQIVFTKETVSALCDAATAVVFVGCWPPEQLKLNTRSKIEWIVVSPHEKAREVAPQAAAERPLYETYPHLAAQVRAASRPGALVLVAAGIVGKVFVHAAAQAGAVALDLGSMADYFAGYSTRSVADIVQA